MPTSGKRILLSSIISDRNLRAFVVRHAAFPTALFSEDIQTAWTWLLCVSCLSKEMTRGWDKLHALLQWKAELSGGLNLLRNRAQQAARIKWSVLLLASPSQIPMVSASLGGDNEVIAISSFPHRVCSMKSQRCLEDNVISTSQSLALALYVYEDAETQTQDPGPLTLDT